MLLLSRSHAIWSFGRRCIIETEILAIFILGLEISLMGQDGTCFWHVSSVKQTFLTIALLLTIFMNFRMVGDETCCWHFPNCRQIFSKIL